MLQYVMHCEQSEWIYLVVEKMGTLPGLFRTANPRSSFCQVSIIDNVSEIKVQ
jgi:hypothetical protein